MILHVCPVHSAHAQEMVKCSILSLFQLDLLGKFDDPEYFSPILLPAKVQSNCIVNSYNLFSVSENLIQSFDKE